MYYLEIKGKNCRAVKDCKTSMILDLYLKNLIITTLYIAVKFLIDSISLFDNMSTITKIAVVLLPLIWDTMYMVIIAHEIRTKVEEYKAVYSVKTCISIFLVQLISLSVYFVLAGIKTGENTCFESSGLCVALYLGSVISYEDFLNNSTMDVETPKRKTISQKLEMFNPFLNTGIQFREKIKIILVSMILTVVMFLLSGPFSQMLKLLFAELLFLGTVILYRDYKFQRFADHIVSLPWKPHEVLILGLGEDKVLFPELKKRLSKSNITIRKCVGNCAEKYKCIIIIDSRQTKSSRRDCMCLLEQYLEPKGTIIDPSISNYIIDNNTISIRKSLLFRWLWIPVATPKKIGINKYSKAVRNIK